MAEIKQYTRQVLPRETVSMQNTSGAFGGGEGFKALGQAAGQVEDKLRDIQQRRDKSEYINKLTAFELENMKAAQELSTQEFDGDAINIYQQSYEQRAAEFENSVPQTMYDQWQVDNARLLGSFAESGFKEQIRRSAAKAAADYENTTQTLVNMARLNPANKDDYIARHNEIVATLPDAVDRIKFKENGIDLINDAAYKSIAKSNPYQFIKDAKSGKYNNASNIDTLLSVADAEIKSREAEQKRIVTEAKSALSDVKDKQASGYIVPEEEWAAAQDIIKKSGDSKLAYDYALYRSAQDYTERFRQLDLGTMDDVINNQLLPAVRDGGAKDHEIVLLEQAQKIRTNAETLIKNDPIEYAANVGVNVGTVDFSDRASIVNRINTAKSVADKYRTDIKPLTENEVYSLSSQLDRSGVEEQFQLIQSLSRAGKDSIYMYKQLGDKESVIAHAGGLLSASPQSASDVRKILIGRKSLKENPDFAPKDVDIQGDFYQHIGDAFRGMPKQERALYEAAKAHYVGSGGFQNDGNFEDSVDAVLGTEIYKRKSRSFVVPIGSSPDEFEDFLDVASDETYKIFSIGGEAPMYSNGKSVTAKDINKHGAFESVGNNLYRLYINDKPVLGSGPDGTYIMQLDASAIKTIAVGR